MLLCLVAEEQASRSQKSSQLYPQQKGLSISLSSDQLFFTKVKSVLEDVRGELWQVNVWITQHPLTERLAFQLLHADRICIYFAHIVSEVQLNYFVLSIKVDWNLPCSLHVLVGREGVASGCGSLCSYGRALGTYYTGQEGGSQTSHAEKTNANMHYKTLTTTAEFLFIPHLDIPLNKLCLIKSRMLSSRPVERYSPSSLQFSLSDLSNTSWTVLVFLPVAKTVSRFQTGPDRLCPSPCLLTIYVCILRLIKQSINCVVWRIMLNKIRIILIN